MSVSVSMDIKVPGIVEDVAELAQAVLVERVFQDSQELVPVRTEALKNSGKFTDDEVIWSKEYAAHVYFGTYMMAPRPWVEQAKSMHYDEWVDWVQDVVEEAL